jgi:hypothetical protein
MAFNSAAVTLPATLLPNNGQELGKLEAIIYSFIDATVTSPHYTAFGRVP